MWKKPPVLKGLPSDCKLNNDDRNDFIEESKEIEESLILKKDEEEVKQEYQEEVKEESKDKKKDIIIEKQKSSYIKKAETVPLQSNHWGRLSELVLNILKIDDFKDNSGYLRNGINFGINKNQSFIACISTLLAYSNKKQIKSLKSMKEHIIKSINIDLFSTYSSGELVSIFFNNSYKVNDKMISKYKTSKYFNDKTLIKKLVNSYDNFCNYIMSDKDIDHTYLWDIVCLPNDKLFKKGCNLIIIEEDVKNINLICPYNKYLKTYRFDVNKPSFIIVKNKVKNIYEPVIYYQNKDNLIYLKLNFYIDNDDNISKFIKKVSIIFNQNKYCGIIPNEDIDIDENNFYKNTSINKLQLLKKYNIPILKEVLNNDLKNIGYIINFNENNLYLPNNPSDKIDIPHVFINSIEFKNNYILDYESTKYALSKLRDLTNNEINNIALSKIVTDDNIIIGLITFIIIYSNNK